MSPGEDMSFCADNSVDLITSAQAMHWFDLDKFYAEATRVLKPNGVLATYGYAIPVLDNPQASLLVQKVRTAFPIASMPLSFYMCMYMWYFYLYSCSTKT